MRFTLTLIKQMSILCGIDKSSTVLVNTINKNKHLPMLSNYLYNFYFYCFQNTQPNYHAKFIIIANTYNINSLTIIYCTKCFKSASASN